MSTEFLSNICKIESYPISRYLDASESGVVPSICGYLICQKISSCIKCAGVIFNIKDVLVWAKCKESFHPTCTRVGTIENFRKLSAQRKATCKCDTCRAETGSTASGSDAEPYVIWDTINNLGKTLSAQIHDVNANVETVKKPTG
ncbi:hypothetical protein J6590_063489 [Homalodisca vitripennis]|nr:hypothetical protein J6590_063489 [Homalodisca vitripennis]